MEEKQAGTIRSCGKIESKPKVSTSFIRALRSVGADEEFVAAVQRRSEKSRVSSDVGKKMKERV